MTIDKFFKIGILLFGVCLVAVLSFAVFARHHYQFIKSSDTSVIFDQKTGQIHMSDGLKTTVMLDLVNGKRAIKPLTSGVTRKERTMPAGTGKSLGVFADLVPTDKVVPEALGTTGNQPQEDLGSFSDLAPTSNKTPQGQSENG